MKKIHTFLVLTGFTDFDLAHPEQQELLVYREEPGMFAIKCEHEEFEDNLVQLEEKWSNSKVTLLRDIDGRYHECWDYLSRKDVVDMFG